MLHTFLKRFEVYSLKLEQVHTNSYKACINIQPNLIYYNQMKEKSVQEQLLEEKEKLLAEVKEKAERRKRAMNPHADPSNEYVK